MNAPTGDPTGADRAIDLRGARWRKSSRSGDNACIEVAGNLPGAVAVRDSKDPTGPTLAFAPDAWRGFVAGVQDRWFLPAHR